MTRYGPKGSPLPTGISWDVGKERLRIAYKGADGEWRREHAGRVLAVAKRLLAQRKREVREGASPTESGLATNLSVNDLAEHWRVAQGRRGRRNLKREYRQFELHIAPCLGNRRVRDVRARDVRDLVGQLEQGLSASSTNNAVSVLRSMFELAVFEEVIEHNPVKALPRGMLPRKSRRKQPTYTNAEAKALMVDGRVPPDRAMLYTLQALTGARVGEVAGVRWEDYDPEAKPLGSLLIARQYDERPLKTATGDDTKDRIVPVHVELARRLDAWRQHGFQATFGRQPHASDPIVPDGRTGTTPRTHSQVTKAPDKDCHVLGIPDKGTHGLRRYFISQARMGGARADVLERITHNRRGETIDAYTSFEWPTLCAATGCLRVDLRASPRDTARDTDGCADRKRSDSERRLVEAVGIENSAFRAD